MLGQQLKLANLKPVKRIHYRLDPMHSKVNSVRRVMHYLSTEKARSTGPKTAFKYDFVSDRSEPTITLTFHDDDQLKVTFKTANLTDYEIVYEMNKIVLPRVKEEKAVVMQTKGSTKLGKKKK